jgi:hypothetical protein
MMELPMAESVTGGFVAYGQIAGILMLDSTIPRIPGDPGHAGTFPFPVRYEVIRDYPFQELIDGDPSHLHLILSAAKELEAAGVSFIAADCGLFSVFQRQISTALQIPFLGSALSLIPLLARFLPETIHLGVITGDTRLLRKHHLIGAGADGTPLVISGMEKSLEFQDVVIHRGNALNVEKMRNEVLEAADALLEFETPLGAVILECSNLASFRSDIQKKLNIPVFDIVTLIEFFAQGYQHRDFIFPYPVRPTKRAP